LNTKLIARFLADGCNSAEKEKVRQWIEADAENQKLMEELEQIWEASSKQSQHFEDLFDPEEDWQHFKDRIKRESKKDASIFPLNYARQGSRNRFSQIRRIAAIIVIAALLGILAYQDLYTETQVADPVLREISIEKGHRGNVTLSDGTQVQLNGDSKIVLPSVFEEDKREITLKGEAFFDVTHNPDRPFIIHVGEGIVRVVGTKLDVRSYPEDDGVRVVVKQGRVELKSRKDFVKGTAVLTAGEMGKLFWKDNQIKERTIDDLDVFISWTQGYLKFKDTPMKEVAKQLERKYDIRVEFRNPELKKLRLTAELKSRIIQHNMEVISTSLDMGYNIDQQVVTFFKK
jgi:ferric-dicitrate binding protein FerR (iron transport regulator)